MCEPCLDSGLKKPTVKRHFSAESSEINAGERGSSTATWVSPTPWRLLFWNCICSHPSIIKAETGPYPGTQLHGGRGDSQVRRFRSGVFGRTRGGAWGCLEEMYRFLWSNSCQEVSGSPECPWNPFMYKSIKPLLWAGYLGNGREEKEMGNNQVVT